MLNSWLGGPARLLAGLVVLGLGVHEAHAQSSVAAIPAEPHYAEQVIEEGYNWQLKSVSGYAVDDTGQYYSNTVYTLQNQEGIYAAPLSPSIQADLAAAVGSGDTVFIVEKNIAAKIAQAEQQGQLPPELQAIAEPLDMHPVPEPIPYPEGPQPLKTDETQPQSLGGSCSDKSLNKTKTFNLNQPISKSTNLGGGFSGSLSTSGSLQGSATGQVYMWKKRKKVLGVCIPYGVKFDKARAYGNVTVNYSATVNGTLSYTYEWQTQLAKPGLGSLNFFVGPVPVHIGFNLPIHLGLKAQASVTGTVSYNGSQAATGNFDYTCTLNGCSGSANYNLSNPSGPSTVTGSVSGRVYPTVWVQAAVRAYLYDEWVAYAQVGVRPHLYGDLWGYYGNTCGDADGNGVNETVSALTFGLDWQVSLTAEAAALGGSPKKWNNLWSSARKHIKFWDLIGSSAARPILTGPTSVAKNSTAAYTAKMRPCWPYSNTVTYKVAWGDGSTTNNLTGAPQTAVGTSKAWSSAGAKSVQLTAVSDSFGRQLNQVTTRTVQVNGSTPTWTAWLDRDNASGNGDYELLSNFLSEGYSVCSNPIGVECQTTSGVNWSSTGEVYSCTLAGGSCANANQADGYCLDYRVRFLCP